MSYTLLAVATRVNPGQCATWQPSLELQRSIDRDLPTILRTCQRSSIEKKGQLGLWQCQASVPSALLLNALNFALNFFLFDTAFSNILCQHYRTNNARMLIPSN